MKLRYVILLCTVVYTATSIGITGKIRNKYDKLKKKISRMMNRKKGNELFLDIDDFEYPGTNDTIRQIHKEQWLEYYDCLKKKYAETGPEKTMYPSALMALEGTLVTLKCQICISPLEMHMIESIEWYFNGNSSSNSISNEPVDYTEHTLISPDDRSLNMYSVQSDQSGQYWCKMKDVTATPYYLHVDNGSEPIRIVRSDEAPRAPHAMPPSIVHQYNMKVYSRWTDWSPCSACDVVGKKLKYGYCTISLLENSAHRYIANESIPKLDRHVKRHLEQHKREDEEVEEIRAKQTERSTDETENRELATLVKIVLPTFRNKLPCRSKYTPKEIQNIPSVKERKTEIIVRYCKLKCPRNMIFEVRDKSGTVLESANNSAGIYSMIQGIPEAPPSVTRITLYQKHNARTVLKCPGNLNTDTPVVWQIGRKVLTPAIINTQSAGRIHIDPQTRMIFAKLLLADANIYSCWQNGELAGTIRLEVTHEIEIKLDHHVLMIGGIAIVSVLLLVFWRAFKGRRRITKH